MQDLIANITINVLRITFSKNNTVSRSTANDWVNWILENDLRSIKLAEQALKLTVEYGRDSNRRILAYRLGAMCGNVSTRVSFFSFSRIIKFHAGFCPEGIRQSPSCKKGADSPRPAQYPGHKGHGVGKRPRDGEICP